MLPTANDISLHTIIVSIVNGAAVGLGINISMVAFFTAIRKLVQFYQEYKNRHTITNVQK